MDKLKTVATFAVPLLMAMLLYFFIAPEFREIPMSIRVSNYIGFDVNTTALTFGTVYLSGSSTREMLVSNEDNYDKTAQFTVEGDMKSFVTAPKDTLVKAGTNTSVPMRADVPYGTPVGNYTGRLVVFLRRAI